MQRYSKKYSNCKGMGNVLYYTTVTHPYLRTYMALPEMTIDQMLSLAYGQAKNLILGNKDQIMPVFMILTGDDEIIFVGTPWRGDNQKNMAAIMLRDMMKEKRAIAYSFLSEAWVASQPQGWKIGDAVDTLPADRPDRKEVVMAMATNGTDTKYKSWVIMRDKEGNCVELVEEKRITRFSMGRFEGLLPSSTH
jgi:hypothetical protein